MLKKTITYVDYDDNKRTEDHYFNLTQHELMEMQLEVDGGLKRTLEKIINENDEKLIMKHFKKIVGLAYGKKSDDGRYFDKSPEISARFFCSAAYETLMNEFMTSPKAAADFINALIPKELLDKAPELSAPSIG